jgi:hypothetical protein
MKLTRKLFVSAFLGAATMFIGQLAQAQQPASASGQLTIDSFNGIYHLGRDNRGLSLLTTEETIVADFPSAGFYGLKRELPKTYQGHNVDVKVLAVSDAAGNPVPYKISSDGGNLLITTGNPAIKLFGSQTIKIRYQTTGVINLKGNVDEFLLNVNGRGWDVPISNADAILYIPSDLQKSIKGKPSCYTSLGNTSSNYCQITSSQAAGSLKVSSKARLLQPHQALVLKVNFAADTFTNGHRFKSLFAILVAIVALLALTVTSYRVLKRRNTTL